MTIQDPTRHDIVYPAGAVSSVVCRQLKWKDVFFYECSECSLLNIMWQLIHTSLAKMTLGIHFPVLLRQTNQQSLVRWTVSVIQEAVRTGTIPVDLQDYWTIVWMISVKLCYALHDSHWEDFLFRADYCMEVYIMLQIECVRNGLCDFLITVYDRL